MTPERLTQQFQRWQPEMLDLLERLVNIDSGTGQKEGIVAILDIVEPLLRGIGMETERHPSPVGPHLVARGATDAPVLLMGHIDTVFPAGTAAERPFRIEGDRAYGPGVADMKSGIVNMIYVVKALAQAGGAHEHVRLIINADEETSSIHSRDITRRESASSRAAFVFEPGSSLTDLTTERKGVGDVTVTVRGKAAHAGSGLANGRSAIDELARKIIALHEITDEKAGRSVNVGLIRGGTARNVVADFAEARVDLRYESRADAEGIMDALRTACQPARDGYDIHVEGGITRPPLERTPAIAALFDHVRATGEQFGIDFREASSGGVSDANIIADAGVPVVDSMGPVGGRVHSADEFLELDTIVPRAAVATLTVYDWIRQHEGAH